MRYALAFWPVLIAALFGVAIAQERKPAEFPNRCAYFKHEAGDLIKQLNWIAQKGNEFARSGFSAGGPYHWWLLAAQRLQKRMERRPSWLADVIGDVYISGDDIVTYGLVTRQCATRRVRCDHRRLRKIRITVQRMACSATRRALR